MESSPSPRVPAPAQQASPAGTEGRAVEDLRTSRGADRRFGRWLKPWRLLRDRELQRHVAVLARHETALQQHASAVEQAFVATGAALQEQTRLTGALVEQGRRFESFTAAEAETNPVRQAIALVEHTVRELDDLHRQGDALVERLRSQHEEIARLQQNGGQLERAIAPLRIVDTLFRIEAATLPSETQVAFSALTGEIAELDRQVRQTFSQQFEALGVTREAIVGVVQHLDAQRAEHQEAATLQRATIEKSLLALEAGVARLHRRDERTAALVREIDGETNGIIVALQYQDITRQKLEHVLTALAALCRRVGAHDATATFVVQAARLQAGQLAAIDRDLQSATNEIDAGLRNLVERLADVEARHQAESEAGDMGAEVEAMVQTLGTILVRLQHSVEAAAANGRAVARAVEAFGGIAADLGLTIRELTWGIRLIALNAQVQAAQVARCDGLEVLARHTFVVSEQTSRLSDGLGCDLSALNTRLQELVREAQSFAKSTEEARRTFDAAAAPTRDAMFAQRTTVVEALHQFSPLLRQTREYAAAVLQHADLKRLDNAPLRALEAELELLGHAASRWRFAATHDVSGDEAFKELEQQYTMESERAVHEAVFRGGEVGMRAAGSGLAAPAAGATPSESHTPAVTATAALGDNVELF